MYHLATLKAYPFVLQIATEVPTKRLDGAGPAAGFVIRPLDFTFRSLRGNAVLRWEYHPGSTLYVVWTRSGESALGRGRIDFGDDASALFRGPSQNIFLIKINYWLGL